MKISKILSIIAFLAIIALVAVLISTNFGIGELFSRFNPKERIVSTAPFALKVKEQETIRTSSLSLDYYICQDSLSVIYSFEATAGIDFKKDTPVFRGDSVFLPYPKVLSVDQNDEQKPWVLMQKGSTGIKDVKPYKIALEKMTKDYAIRSELRERSAESLIQYFESIDTVYHYTFLPNTEHERQLFQLPFSPITIDFFPGLTSADYCFFVDSTKYERHEMILGVDDKPIVTFSYLGYYPDDFETIRKDLGEGYTYISDPNFSSDKFLAITHDYSCMFLDGNMFLVEYYPDINEEEYINKYFPDLIYFLFCMNLDRNRSLDGKYERWINDYDECIESINKGRFLYALSKLNEMSTLQEGNVSRDEKILSSLCEVLSNRTVATYSDYDFYDLSLSGYHSLFDKGEDKLNEEENRINLLQKLEGTSLHEMLECYFLKNHECSDREMQDYVMDIVQKGLYPDKDIIQKLSSKQYLNFMVALWHNNVRDKLEVDGTKKEFDEVFPWRKYRDNDVIIMRDMLNVKTDKYGSDDEIISNLRKEGLVIGQEPMFILLIQQKHNASGFDQDALVFTKDSLMFFGNYNGIRSQDGYYTHYEDAIIDGDYLTIHPKDKYKIHAPITVKMVKLLKDAYLRKNRDDDTYALKVAYKNHLIDVANSSLSTFTYQGDPIDYIAY